jgi:DNA-directed RNA polymerase specialized sigma24 family protein
MDPRTAIASLSRAEFDRLRRFASTRLRCIPRRGYTEDDLVGDAILSVLEGGRRWDPARGGIFMYLQGVICSQATHDERRPDALYRLGPLDEFDDEGSTIFDSLAAEQKSPEELAIVCQELGTAMEDAARSQHFPTFLRVVRGDTQRSIALERGVSETRVSQELSEVRNAARVRLRRRAAREATA